ncbi:MAG: Gfo/Idh/MocA family oxidoreductase [Lachnospiraceae bacterium]|nr:Gfo/Idh/MocA family oxidoreductase [Lachnospiraceae bacterium]
MEERRIRWGVLGCAGIARKAMIPAILRAGNAKLYAIASRKGAKLAEFSELFHPEVGYSSYEELLSDPDVDAVYIPVPNSEHARWVIKACEAGKPVLCEKPLAMNRSEVIMIREASEKYGVPVMEAFAYLHGPMMKKIREIVSSGTIGKIRYMEANFSFWLDDLTNVRLIGPLGGGAAYDLGCYPVSFFREVTGEEPERIVTFKEMGKDSKVDETVLSMMEFPSGAKACTYFSFQSNWCTRNLILGEKGQIDIPSIFDRGAEKEMFLTIGRPPESSTEKFIIDCSDNYVLQVEQMGRVAAGLEKPAISLDWSEGNAIVLDEWLKQEEE